MSNLHTVKVPAWGPAHAEVLIVGEAPGLEEVKRLRPFVGNSGGLLDSVLHETGFLRADCRITNVCQVRPPGNNISHFFGKKPQGTEWQLINDRWCSPEMVAGLEALDAEITNGSFKVIIALGDTALWALTGKTGITKWRGSVIEDNLTSTVIIPTYHPAAVLRMWSWRFIMARDFRRAKTALEKRPSPPPYTTVIADGEHGRAVTELKWLEHHLALKEVIVSLDIETRGGHIDCIGFAYYERKDKIVAVTVPFFSLNRPEGFWTLEEETAIVSTIRRIVGHPNARLILQNGLYDMQYLARHWGVYAVPHMDTMIAHAVCFPSLPKSLDFLSSLYLPYHRYWKDESKEADARMDDLQRWEYNAKDCVTTLLLVPHLQHSLEELNLQGPFAIEMSLFEPVMHMMMRGVNIDLEYRNKLMMDLMDLAAEYGKWFEWMMAPALGDTKLVKSKTAKPWYDSPQQQMTLFYELLGVKEVRHRKTRRPTVDDDALKVIAKREPLLAPILDKMAEYRSIKVFLNTFVLAKLDHDKRMRSSYGLVGTETFRFNSSADVFGFGTNLQNIPAAKGELS